MATLNVRYLKRIGQLSELTASAAERNIDIVCVQKDKVKKNTSNGWTFISASAWKNSIYAIIEGVAIFLSPHSLKSLKSIEKIQPRMMVATFNGNSSRTIISCCSLTNANDETDLITYNELSSLIRSIPKHKVLFIGRNMNAQIGKNENSKFSSHDSSNRNGETLTVFSLKNGLTCLNTKLQKRKGKLWTYTYTNNAKAQIDYTLINKKWINSALNCEVYSSFEYVSSDHRIVSVKIRLSVRKNTTQTIKTPHYDLSLLNNRDICDKYTLTLWNKFEALQEISETLTPNACQPNC